MLGISKDYRQSIAPNNKIQYFPQMYSPTHTYPAIPTFRRYSIKFGECIAIIFISRSNEINFPSQQILLTYNHQSHYFFCIFSSSVISLASWNKFNDFYIFILFFSSWSVKRVHILLHIIFNTQSQSALFVVVCLVTNEYSHCCLGYCCCWWCW